MLRWSKVRVEDVRYRRRPDDGRSSPVAGRWIAADRRVRWDADDASSRRRRRRCSWPGRRRSADRRTWSAVSVRPAGHLCKHNTSHSTHRSISHHYIQYRLMVRENNPNSEQFWLWKVQYWLIWTLETTKSTNFN